MMVAFAVAVCEIFYLKSKPLSCLYVSDTTQAVSTKVKFTPDARIQSASAWRTLIVRLRNMEGCKCLGTRLPLHLFMAYTSHNLLLLD